jgi:hypothetical protein
MRNSESIPVFLTNLIHAPGDSHTNTHMAIIRVRRTGDALDLGLRRGGEGGGGGQMSLSR